MPRTVLPIVTSTAGYTVLEKMLAERSYSNDAHNIILACPICGVYNLTSGPEHDQEPPMDAGWHMVRARDRRHP